MKAKDLKRFWEKVDRKTGNCWTWTAYRDRKGYGQFRINDRMTKAHRFSWGLENGSIPEGLCVLHHCDNPGCVRPDHLFLGTNADNVADKVAKGRQARLKGEEHGMYGKGYLQQGEEGPNSKLDDTAVRIIRTLHRDFEFKQLELANLYNVSQAQISYIVNRKQWTHI